MAAWRRGHANRSLLSPCCLIIAALGARVLGILPRCFCFWGTEVVADLAFARSRAYRGNVAANLRRVLGPDATDDDVTAAARAAFRTSAHNIEELLWLSGVSSARLARSVSLKRGDWALLEQERARGRGVVVLTGHIGAFDILGHALAGRGFRLTAVTGRTLPRPLYDAAVALRGAHGMTVVDASSRGVRAMVAALHAGDCAGFVGDRDFFGNGAPVDFFGRRTTLPSGAVRAARVTGAPIVAAYVRRTVNGYAVDLDEPFTVARTADRERDIARGMERVAASLTRAIAASPGEWAMFQLVWPASDRTD